MEFKKIIPLAFAILSPLFINAHADQTSNTFCSTAPGHWQGIYTVKDQNVCKLYNGCTHLIMADVTHVSKNEYHINLKPSVGTGGEFSVNCDNGVITSPIPNSKAAISCDDTNHCFVLYDDPRLTSEMMKS